MSEFEDLDEPQLPEQLDLLLVKDTIQTADRLLKRCAQDRGDRFLADLVDRKPSTVHNQLDGSDPDKSPSFAVAIALAMTHRRFAAALCKLLSPPPRLEPEDAIEEIERDVLPALGAHDSKKLRSILRRTLRRGAR